MAQPVRGLGRRIATEVVWIFGYWMVAFLLTGWMLGFEQLFQSALDIQMRNTYFVVPGLLVPLPFFLLEATFITGIRMFASGLRDNFLNGLFTALAALSFSLFYWLKQSIH